MAAQQSLVGQIESRWSDRTGNHVLRAPEVVLVVGVPGRTVGEHEGGLSRPSCPTAALGVVGRGGGHVAHVDGVQFGDIHAQFHGGRAEHERQALQGGIMGILLRPVLPVVLAEAKALLQQLALLGVHLGCVFAGLEGEQGVGRLAQHVSNTAIQRAKKGIGCTALPGGAISWLVFGQAPLQGPGAEPPALHSPGKGLAHHIAMGCGGLQHGLDQLRPCRFIPGPDLLCQSINFESFPLHLAHQAGARPGADQIIPGSVPVIRGPGKHQVTALLQPFFQRHGPGFPQHTVGAGADAFLLPVIEVAAFQAEVVAQGIEEQLVEPLALVWGQLGQSGVMSEDGLILAKGGEVPVVDGEQTELLQVGVVVAPAAAQVAQQAIGQDEAQRALRLMQCRATEPGVHQIFGEDVLCCGLEAQGIEDGLGQMRLRQRPTLQGAQQTSAQGEHLDEIVEVPGLQGGILAVVGKAQ